MRSLNMKAMSAAELEDAFGLLSAFLTADQHYRDSSSAYGDGGPEALRRALTLFLERPELGCVWLAYNGRTAVGCCVACYAISTAVGATVAKLDDVCVLPGHEGLGIGTAMIGGLEAGLRDRGVRRIDTSCHIENPRARDFYVRLGFRPLNEERLALLL